MNICPANDLIERITALCEMLEKGAKYNGLLHSKQLEIDRLKREVQNKDDRIAILQRALDAPKYPMCMADDREDGWDVYCYKWDLVFDDLAICNGCRGYWSLDKILKEMEKTND